MLYLAAIGYLMLASEMSQPCWWRIFALCLALLPWAKREGVILWAIAALIGILITWRSQRRWIRLLWLLPGPVIVFAWKTFYAAMGKTGAFEYLPMTLATLVKNAPRAGFISQAAINEMTEVRNWSVFWPIAAVAFVSLFWRARDRRLLILFVAATAPIVIYCFLYLFSGWPDWTAHVEQSLSRLLLHVMPVIWLGAALALRPPVRPANAPFISAPPSI